MRLNFCTSSSEAKRAFKAAIADMAAEYGKILISDRDINLEVKRCKSDAEWSDFSSAA